MKQRQPAMRLLCQHCSVERFWQESFHIYSAVNWNSNRPDQHTGERRALDPKTYYYIFSDFSKRAGFKNRHRIPSLPRPPPWFQYLTIASICAAPLREMVRLREKVYAEKLTFAVQFRQGCYDCREAYLSGCHSFPSSKSTFSQPFKNKCTSDVVRIGSISIFRLSKLWKAKFSILRDVIFLVRL